MGGGCRYVNLEARLFVFYQGGGDCGHIWYSVFDGREWSRGRRLPETGLSEGPSVVEFNLDIYCFHKGMHDEREMWYNVLAKGYTVNSTPRGDAKVPDTYLAGSPAAVAAHDKIFCFHAGASNYDGLWYNILDPHSGHWVGEQQVPLTGTGSGPGVTLYNNDIYCFHQGKGDDRGSPWYNVLDPATNAWHGDKLVPRTGMSAQPSPVVYNNKIYFFHHGSNNCGELWYNVFDGENWEGDKMVTSMSGMSCSPSAVVLGNQLYCFYNKDGQLRYTIFDGQHWSHELQVPWATISNSPSAVKL